MSTQQTSPEVAVSAASQAEPGQTEGEREPVLLIVDDESGILTALSRLLRREPYQVVTANSGEEALEMLPELRPAVILSDQRMSGITGVEFLHRARQVNPDAVRMILTGYADLASTIDAINLGEVSRFITKPWNDAELRITLREAMEKFRLMQENREMMERIRQQNEELARQKATLEDQVLERTRALVEKYRQHRQLYLGALQSLVAILEARDPYTRDHAQRVAREASSLARQLGMSDQQIEGIRIAGTLHDIGKVGWREEILHKAGPLNEMEWHEVKRHPVVGEQVLRAIDELKPLLPIIRHHHERYDGKGYPDRLARSQIPLGASLLAVADSYDAMLSRRPYRGALSRVEALERIEQGIGSQFDPDVGRAFVAMRSTELAREQVPVAGSGTEP